MVLSFSPTSAATIGYPMGAVLIGAAITEFIEAGVVEGWRWVHVVLGVLFVIVGVMALLEPFQTFGILAVIIGWSAATFEVVFAIAARRELGLWGLMAFSGIVEIAIGVWAIGSPARSAWLLVIWVGIGAPHPGHHRDRRAVQLHEHRDPLAAA